MDDVIGRKQAIDAIESIDWYHQNRNKDMVSGANSAEHQAWYKAEDVYQALELLPSAQPERKKGNWILIADGYTDYVKCDQCGNISYVGRNFCSSCGADMRIKETDNDYERAVDQLEHDILYEPTFNQDDGSM